jgi:carboxyl-terminal processing protease
MASLLPASAVSLSSEERQRQLDSFDKVWQTIHDKHWETKPGGTDWDKVRAELRPRAERAQSAREVRDLIREMLHRLKQSHFNLISSESMGDLKDAPSGEGAPGFEAEVIDSREALITRVDSPGPPVQMGWQILTIDGVDINERIRVVGAAYTSSSEKELRLYQMLRAHLSGTPGTKLPMEFRNNQGTTVKLMIPIREPKGHVTSFGNLPPQAVEMESRLLDGPIGYVRFTLFLDPVRLMQTFSEAISACLKCQGFIVDVRGNPGGLGIMATGVAGWFVEQSNLRLGSMYTRDSTLNFVVNPRGNPFSGKLAILIDGASASTSEIFAGGMQDLHRARIFGERSAAAALPSMIERLPNGDGFQYAMANYISEGGKSLEGNGVKPDVEVHRTRETLMAGRDAVIDAAVRWIQKGK